MAANNKQTKQNLLAPNMPKGMFEECLKLMQIPASNFNESLISLYICKELDKIDNVSYKIDQYNNILVTKGNSKIYPFFCSHLDTVHTYLNSTDKLEIKVKQYKKHTYLYAYENKKQVGIGGDDKNGIFVCLQLLKNLKNIKVAFFSQEESGGTGSGFIETSFFNNVSFITGIDRWNSNHVCTSYMNEKSISKRFKKQLKPLMKKYGFVNESGMFTDCFNLDIDLSKINVSCGYYVHHTDNEYIDVNELYLSYLFCVELSKLATQKYEYKFKYYSKSVYKYSNKNSKSKTVYGDYQTDFYDYCNICGVWLDHNEFYKGICRGCEKSNVNSIIDYEQYSHCVYCHSYLISMHEKNEGLCYSCIEYIENTNDKSKIKPTKNSKYCSNCGYIRHSQIESETGLCYQCSTDL